MENKNNKEIMEQQFLTNLRGKKVYDPEFTIINPTAEDVGTLETPEMESIKADSLYSHIDVIKYDYAISICEENHMGLYSKLLTISPLEVNLQGIIEINNTFLRIDQEEIIYDQEANSLYAPQTSYRNSVSVPWLSEEEITTLTVIKNSVEESAEKELSEIAQQVENEGYIHLKPPSINKDTNQIDARKETIYMSNKEIRENLYPNSIYSILHAACKTVLEMKQNAYIVYNGGIYLITQEIARGIPPLPLKI